MNYNKCIFMGNLTRDPETKTLGSGQSVTTFGIAVNSRRGQGKPDEVLYVKVDLWGKQGEVVQQYLKKGSSILVEGRLRMEEYTTREGEKRQSLALSADSMQLGPKNASPGVSDQGGSYGGGSYGGDYDQAPRGGSSAGPARGRDSYGSQEPQERRRNFDEPAMDAGGPPTEDDLPF